MIINAHRFSVAPMMDWTDRLCRAFHRTLSTRARLYSEMVTADAVLHGDRDRLLAHSDAAGPSALQLGGSDPRRLGEAAGIGAGYGYQEINLNVGCPSDRVQEGRFGACLMREPALVAECLAAMREGAGAVEVTVKHRLGVDDDDPRHSLFGFVETVSRAGVSTFIVHARKAWLQGLSPKENRDIPPLDFGLVAELKRARPDLTIVVNGGVRSLEEAGRLLAVFDGVMLGRAAYQDPALLLGVDALLETGAIAPPPSRAARAEAVAAFRPRIAAELSAGVRLHAITRHMLGLMNGLPGARAWRRILSEEARAARAGLEVIDRALQAVGEARAGSPLAAE